MLPDLPLTFDDEQQFVLVLVMVPVKQTPERYQFYLRAIDVAAAFGDQLSKKFREPQLQQWPCMSILQ
jgi:hypothetical protein